MEAVLATTCTSTQSTTLIPTACTASSPSPTILSASGLIEPLSIHDPPSLEYLRVGGALAHKARLLGTPGCSARRSRCRMFVPRPRIPTKRRPTSPPTRSTWPPACRSTNGSARAAASARSCSSRPAASINSRPTTACRPMHRGFLPTRSSRPTEPAHAVGHGGDGGRAGRRRRRAGISTPRTACRPTTTCSMMRRWRCRRSARRCASDEEFGRQRPRRRQPVPAAALLCPARQFSGWIRRPSPSCSRVGRTSPRCVTLDASTCSNPRGDPRRHRGGARNASCAPRMCLFHVDAQSRLMPLAIQLGQSPAAGPIFTPLDDPWLWRTVKAHVGNVPTRRSRNVSRTLLRTPHGDGDHRSGHAPPAQHRPSAAPAAGSALPFSPWRSNRAARDKMLAPGGPIDNTTWASAAVWRAGLVRQGLEGLVVHPVRFARRPSPRAASTIRNCCRAITIGTMRSRSGTRSPSSPARCLRQFYRGDADVAADGELQAWVRELADLEIGNSRGLPTWAAASPHSTGWCRSRRRSCSSPRRSIRGPTTASTICTATSRTSWGRCPLPPPRSKAPLSEQEPSRGIAVAGDRRRADRHGSSTERAD